MSASEFDLAIRVEAILYYGLANAQMRSGEYAATLATCRLGISRNLDGENIRLTLLRLGHLQHDAALISEQEAWLKQHPDSPLLLINDANFAQAEGRMKDAQALFDQAWEVYKRQGVPSASTRFKMEMSIISSSRCLSYFPGELEERRPGTALADASKE